MNTALSEPEALASSDTKKSVKPLFQQVSDHIWSDIMAKNSAQHVALPSERDVAEHYGVSRMTARRALEALELKGLVYSEHRKGRFVSPPRFKYDLSRGYHFFQDAQERGADLDISVVSQAATSADEHVARKLGIENGEPIFEYTRLFRSAHHAIFVETEYLVASRFPGFLENDLNQSTTHIFENQYETYAETGDIVISMRSVEQHEARWLGLTESQSAVELQQVISDKNGVPFCYGRLLWRGELTEFTARTVVNQDAS